MTLSNTTKDNDELGPRTKIFVDVLHYLGWGLLISLAGLLTIILLMSLLAFFTVFINPFAAWNDDRLKRLEMRFSEEIEIGTSPEALVAFANGNGAYCSNSCNQFLPEAFEQNLCPQVEQTGVDRILCEKRLPQVDRWEGDICLFVSGMYENEELQRPLTTRVTIKC